MQILRAFGAILIGLILGGVINMSIILLGGELIPPPAGVDPASTESIAANIHLYEFKHYIPPFLAHFFGTLSGALIAFLIAGQFSNMAAYINGVVFLAGGIAAATMLPASITFIAVDLIFAYLPAAYLAIQIGLRLTGSPDKQQESNNV